MKSIQLCLLGFLSLLLLSLQQLLLRLLRLVEADSIFEIREIVFLWLCDIELGNFKFATRQQ